MNRNELVRAISDETGFRIDHVSRVVQAMCDVIVRTVADGDDVTIANFGAWRAVDAPRRNARNPQTGERVVLPPRRVMRFQVMPTATDLVRRATSTYRGIPVTVAKRSKGSTFEVPTIDNVRRVKR